MKDSTRKQFNALTGQIGIGYGVTNVNETFSVAPSIEQRLQDKIVEKEEFLGQINVLPVDDLEGENILGSASGPVSGRTDTSVEGKERKPKDILGMEKAGYRLYPTNSDVYITYKTMDAWAKFPDLPDRYTGYVQERIAKDRITIGWFGEEAAKDTDISANPLMQDVNIGWMQYMRLKLAKNILTQGANANEIRIGAGGDFLNLDHVVADLLQGIPTFLRSDLISLIGSELVGNEQVNLFKAVGAKPTEKTMAVAAQRDFGSLPWMTPNNFPARGLVITSLKNLSIYHQSGSWRRRIKDKPEKDRIEDYNSRNEGYVVETPEQFVGLEFKNVKLPNAAGDGWE